MYNQISLDKYNHYQQRFMWDIHKYWFAESKTFGETCFNILSQSTHFIICDLALFKAHLFEWRDKGNTMDSFYLGMRVVQAFTSFWDYVGYSLNTIFELALDERSVNFTNAINEMKKNYGGDIILEIDKLKKLFSGDSELRKYRHEFTHRINALFTRKSENDTPQQKVKLLDQMIDESYSRLINGLEIYYGFIKQYSPQKLYGSLPKKK